MKKLVRSLKEAIQLCGLKDGMTVSFHHHLRNGDYVLNMVLEAARELGLKDLRVAASSIFPVHEPLIGLIRDGVVSRLDTNYMSGPVAEAVSGGILAEPVVFRSHGGRPRAIEKGELTIDVAFIAAPCTDARGNMNGIEGPSACGSLGYAFPDAMFARKVVAVTDCVVDYPLTPVSLSESYVDYVVQVDKIGDPRGIVSGTTRVTRDPVGLVIARNAAQVICHSGLLVEGFSFQTGAGGASLAAAYYLKEIMQGKGIKGSYGLGGITGCFVEFLREGLFQKLLDVQCFDLEAVKSLKDNPNHQEISASAYANPASKSCAVDKLDVVILGATEIDTSFNVNVHTNSSGVIIGGSGGHSDAAAGAKLTIIAAPLFRGRLPIVVDRVLTVSTPGEAVDVLVTERGIAVNPQKPEMKERLTEAGLRVLEIEELKKIAHNLTGQPKAVRKGQKVVAEVEYRTGEKLDTIWSVS
jgi:citrate lyase subunit alpha/citrate CoA-transferase